MRLWYGTPSPTLRDLFARERVVALRCEACGHEARADLRRLIHDHGTETAVGRLPFVCSCCGGRHIAVKAA